MQYWRMNHPEKQPPADLSLDSESVYESAKELNGNSTLEKKSSDSISSPEKKASDAVMPTSDSQEEEEEELVFCDATKQLLVRHLPPVLTLHLKRFLQEGRRLRKNGCHIEFPDLLDMAPLLCGPLPGIRKLEPE